MQLAHVEMHIQNATKKKCDIWIDITHGRHIAVSSSRFKVAKFERRR